MFVVTWLAHEDCAECAEVADEMLEFCARHHTRGASMRLGEHGAIVVPRSMTGNDA